LLASPTGFEPVLPP